MPSSEVNPCSKSSPVFPANSFESSALKSENTFGKVPDCPTKSELGPTISRTRAYCTWPSVPISLTASMNALAYRRIYPTITFPEEVFSSSMILSASLRERAIGFSMKTVLLCFRARRACGTWKASLLAIMTMSTSGEEHRSSANRVVWGVSGTFLAQCDRALSETSQR